QRADGGGEPGPGLRRDPGRRHRRAHRGRRDRRAGAARRRAGACRGARRADRGARPAARARQRRRGARAPRLRPRPRPGPSRPTAERRRRACGTLMRIAFYAPMKPPDHATPSGDVRVARLLIAALRRAGNRVELASRLRSWEGTGDARRQARIAALGARNARRLVARYRRAPAGARPDLWFTYHLYHKAPDWIGP